MTDELTVNQLDPVPDLSPNSRSSTADRGMAAMAAMGA